MSRKRNSKKGRGISSMIDEAGNQSKSSVCGNQSVASSRVSGDDATLYTKEGLMQSMKDKLAEIETKGRQTLEEIQTIHATLRLNLKQHQLKTVISLEKLSDLSAILDGSIFEVIDKKAEVEKLMTPGSLYRPRKSRSIERKPMAVIEESPKIRPGRSSSVGASPAPFRTPAYRSLVQQMMSVNKYTVRKPCEQLKSGVSMERAMRPGEVAISTQGSPLFVSRVPCEPEVNIPLQNGMILNIDPEHPSRRMHIPPLDETTKQKIKILCEKLQKCITE